MYCLKCNSGINLNPVNKNVFTISFVSYCIRALIPLKQNISKDWYFIQRGFDSHFAS